MTTPRMFDHVIIIMFENMYRSYVMENDYFKSLAEQGIDMRNYFGVMHPSQTNYISSIAGELCNVTDDDRPSPLAQRTIVDLIEEQGLSWKAYMDGYTPVPWTPDLAPADQYPYVIKHDPFSSFENIISSQDRWAKIDNQFGFYTDVANGTLPNYSWFTPDMWNDGHYLVGTQTDPAERAPALVDQQANWLKYFFGNLQFPGPNSLLPDNTLVVVTFDEADFEADWDQGKKYTYDGPNQIYTVLLGDQLAAGQQEQGYNHYSLLRTIEENFELGNLAKNDADANWFQFLNQQSFNWGEAVEISELRADIVSVAACYLGDDLVLACATQSDIQIWQCCACQWSLNGSVSVDNPLAVGLCESFDDGGLDLFYTNGDGINVCPISGLQNSTQIASGSVKNFSVHNAWGGPGNAAHNAGVTMLVWSNDQGQLQSLSRQSSDSQTWPTDIVAINQTTQGDFALASIGPSVYLVFQQGDTSSMQVLSYNLADFNVVSYADGKWSGSYDNTTVNQWNPSSFPVAHFSHMASPVTPGEEEPLTQAYEGVGPFAAATLNGVIHFTHQGSDSNGLKTSTLSIAGLMTPELPVSYNQSDATKTSNGYGGLAEAGWSEQACLFEGGEVSCSAMAANQQGVSLVYQLGGNGPVYWKVGGY